MGMSIDDVEQWARQNNYTIVSDDWWNAAQDTINKYQQLQSDYENRLKADLVAILTDFLMDIEENTSINATNSDERNGKRLMRTEIIGMFEQKINSLKEALND